MAIDSRVSNKALVPLVLTLLRCLKNSAHKTILLNLATFESLRECLFQTLLNNYLFMNEDRLFCDARLIFSPLSKRLNGICHLSTKFFWTPIVRCVEVMCECYENKDLQTFYKCKRAHGPNPAIKL